MKQECGAQRLSANLSIFSSLPTGMFLPPVWLYSTDKYQHREDPGARLRSWHFLSPDHVRVRRGFRSYFYNYLDEIAMATCAAIPSNGPGVVYAVRRYAKLFLRQQ